MLAVHDLLLRILKAKGLLEFGLKLAPTNPSSAEGGSLVPLCHDPGFYQILGENFRFCIA
jgi:hypothetical protein